MSQYQFGVENAAPSHLPALVALGGHHYPAGHAALSETFLRWFYFDNPAGPAQLVIARAGAEWVGLIALIPVLLQAAFRPQRACFAVHVLTHPAHRGKNLFGRMIDQARTTLAEQDCWLLGHPNGGALPGWQRQQMQFRDALRPYMARFAAPFGALRTRQLSSVAELAALPAALWRAGAGAVALQSDPAWLAWRFLAPPHRRYAVAAVERHGEVLGLRVTRRFKHGVDLMVDFVGPAATLGSVIGSVRRPTLVLHSGVGASAAAVEAGCRRLPLRRAFPFFVSDWLGDASIADHALAGITLAASDF
jgi:hypothetical protein